MIESAVLVTVLVAISDAICVAAQGAILVAVLVAASASVHDSAIDTWLWYYM